MTIMFQFDRVDFKVSPDVALSFTFTLCSPGHLHFRSLTHLFL